MKILISIDSFKGSLSSLQAGNAVKEAICRVAKHKNEQVDVLVRPLSDGGEGMVDAFYQSLGGDIIELSVCGPRCNPTKAKYCITSDKKTAIIEMAQAAGITLLPKKDLNPMETTTYGVGEIIRDAIERGCERFVVGIGGSATNDGGTGMLSALGFDFLDGDGQRIPLGAKGLEKLCAISDKNVIPQLKNCTFRIACDVTNPLCGENGCSAVFAPQKGATPEMIQKMDTYLANYGKIAATVSKKSDMNHPGVGAAGGLGFAFLSFTNATLESGIKIVIEETRLEEHIKNCDLVVTGEGRLDAQTVMGKAPIGVAKLAKKYEKPVIAFSGCVTEDATLCNEHGIDAFFPILRAVTSLDEALEAQNAYKNLSATAEQVFRLLNLDK